LRPETLSLAFTDSAFYSIQVCFSLFFVFSPGGIPSVLNFVCLFPELRVVSGCAHAHVFIRFKPFGRTRAIHQELSDEISATTFGVVVSNDRQYSNTNDQVDPVLLNTRSSTPSVTKDSHQSTPLSSNTNNARTTRKSATTRQSLNKTNISEAMQFRLPECVHVRVPPTLFASLARQRKKLVSKQTNVSSSAKGESDLEWLGGLNVELEVRPLSLSRSFICSLLQYKCFCLGFSQRTILEGCS
jgi:hypothetical protein